ncbi:MAG: hypothetical protein QM691_11105 [Opitutaceae bacterium]
MNVLRTWAVLAIVMVAVPLQAACAGEADRTAAAALVAYGRDATVEERSAGSARDKQTLAELLEAARQKLRGDAAERRATFARAYRDVFGVAASEADVAAAPARLYLEHEAVLLATLSGQPDDYRRVIERAYQAALGRAPFAEEYGYWAEFRPLPHLLLVGCVENWARRNAPGLMATTGVPTIGADAARPAVFRLTPALADEVRRALGQPLAPRDLAAGRTVIGPGAEAVVSVGGMAVLVIGGEKAP